MKNWHTEKIKIDDTYLDHTNTVSIIDQIKIFENVTFNHSTIMGLDHKSMIDNSNAFWVVSKIKGRFKKPISSNKQVRATTWTHELGSARAIRDCVIKSGNTVNSEFTAEWCCLDYETRKLRRLNSIKYPDLEMEKTKKLKFEFSNLKVETTDKDFAYERTVRSTDIDINNHTNNLKYNFMVFDAFSVEELHNISIKEYEIYFVSESYEGDKIQIFKKKVKNQFYVEGKVQEKTIFRAVIIFKKLKK